MPKTVEERLANYELGENGCWEWKGALLPPSGYGVYTDAHLTEQGRRRTVYMHRLSYEYYIGPIPEGLTIDHLCRNTKCFNPTHLEAVTQKENNRRGYGASGNNARKTHCVKGHAFDVANTHQTERGRGCRECGRLKQQALRDRLKAEKLAKLPKQEALFDAA